jgi:hypothetical protein
LHKRGVFRLVGGVKIMFFVKYRKLNGFAAYTAQLLLGNLEKLGIVPWPALRMEAGLVGGDSG